MGLGLATVNHADTTMRSMTLRSELESYVAELSQEFAPGSTGNVVERLNSILTASIPRVLTTLEELNSEEAARALCLIPPDGSGVISLYERTNGSNTWAGIGSDYSYSSASLLEEFADRGIEARFTMIEAPAA